MKQVYKQVTMGRGERSDFTKVPQQEHDPGFVYDQEKITSIKSRVSKHVQKSGNLTTFGSPFKSYEKSMVSEGLQHWTGRGPACDFGNSSDEMRLLRKRNQTYAKQNRDRGLLLRGSLKKQPTSR